MDMTVKSRNAERRRQRVSRPALMRQARDWSRIMDTTRTLDAKHESRAHRVDERQRAAQQRLADLSFSRFMREHNARRQELDQ